MSMALRSSIVTMLSVSSSIAERMLLYICKGRPRMPLEIKGNSPEAARPPRPLLLVLTAATDPASRRPELAPRRAAGSTKAPPPLALGPPGDGAV
ncbi:unnamed protein product [Rangifer tarandus platyrhynchus]|uniref:Uncharacterized protein n=1 Tax=Rangifer tarandus platyrhynchus TaxID=3082113 RepID=A0AC59YDV5_RANTA